MSSFVVDCSVAAAWLFSDEATPKSEELLDRLTTESALVPSLWFLELTNVLAGAERKGRISAADLSIFLTSLEQLDLEIDSDYAGHVFASLLPLCRTHRLTSYDAVYLELALRRQLPLATLDQSLRKAAAATGIELLGV